VAVDELDVIGGAGGGGEGGARGDDDEGGRGVGRRGEGGDLDAGQFAGARVGRGSGFVELDRPQISGSVGGADDVGSGADLAKSCTGLQGVGTGGFVEKQEAVVGGRRRRCRLWRLGEGGEGECARTNDQCPKTECAREEHGNGGLDVVGGEPAEADDLVAASERGVWTAGGRSVGRRSGGIDVVGQDRKSTRLNS